MTTIGEYRAQEMLVVTSLNDNEIYACIKQAHVSPIPPKEVEKEKKVLQINTACHST